VVDRRERALWVAWITGFLTKPQETLLPALVEENEIASVALQSWGTTPLAVMLLDSFLTGGCLTLAIVSTDESGGWCGGRFWQ